MPVRSGLSYALCLSLFVLVANCGSQAESQESSQQQNPTAVAESIFEATGVEGGLVVHLGCRDGQLTAALGNRESVIVHGLERDVTLVRQARTHVRDQGIYGRVSVEQLTGDRLPYTDNLVNLIVADEAASIARSEMLRVLCPGGVLYSKDDAGWSKTSKPRPANIDEWTHFLHGPDNNAVARDSVVGAPHHLQWIGGPKWARGHEVLATISMIVTSGGRIFYVADEGPIASVDLPSSWVLVARDAFNGVLLWKKPIPKWESRYRPFRSGPTHLPRRLVALGDKVYVTLGFGQPLVALNAATGVIEQTYEQTVGTEEILVADKTLYLVIGDPKSQEAADVAVRRGQPIPPVHKTIMAIDAESQRILWKKSDSETADLFSQTLAVHQGRAFLQNTRAVICLDAATGDQLWRTKRPASLKRPAWSVPTLVAYQDIVISADRQAPEKAVDDSKPQHVNWTVSFKGGNAPPGEMIAFSAETGRRLWSAPCKEGYNAPVDVLLADGLLWTGDLVKARDPGITEARDPLTGVVKRTRPSDLEFFTPGMSHHRCYRNRGTSNFILLGRSGVELLDLKTGRATANHWIRGTCQFGVLPANGMVYVPPHTCACYAKTKLNGFNALAPRRTKSTREAAPRLEKGPAYADLQPAAAPVSDSQDRSEDWPTFRHDGARSGSASTNVSGRLAPAWRADIGGQLSTVVAAEGKVFVARLDTHSVHAIDDASGKQVWSFATGGRVDSPPTIHRGLVLFGSTDGWVYCLTGRDGKLAWRFRAGTEDRRIVVDGNLESVWPLHGSVLVHQDVVYFAAGRSSFLDGGIHLVGIDPFTGTLVSESRISARDPETGEQPKDIIKGFDMPGGLPDVLSSDGEFIFMRDLKFDAQCAQSEAGGTHLFSPTGFLDDSWWHRSYWLFGTNYQAGWGGWHREGNTVPAGRLLVFNEDTIFGFGRNMYPKGNAGQWTTGEYYRLYAAAKQLNPVKPPAKPRGNSRRRPYPQSRVDYQWSFQPGLEARAMVLAGQTLFVAGPHGETHKSLAAFEGKQGISLNAFATTDGQPLSKVELDSLPVFDGLAAANGRLYLATKDGQVMCFAGK